MEGLQTEGKTEKISRLDQISKTHEEMFNLLEIYLQDCLTIVKEKRLDAQFTYKVDKIKEFYTLIQNSKEKQ